MTVCIMAWDWFITMPLSKSKIIQFTDTVYPKKYAHGFVVLCFVVVMQSFIMNSHEVFIHIHQGCFAGTGAIVRLPQCQWSKPDGYGKISQCNHNKAQQSKNRVHISWDILYIQEIPRLLSANTWCRDFSVERCLFWFIFHWSEFFTIIWMLLNPNELTKPWIKTITSTVPIKFHTRKGYHKNLIKLPFPYSRQFILGDLTFPTAPTQHCQYD